MWIALGWLLLALVHCAFGQQLSGEVWPERVAFRPSSGVFKETRSPAGTYVYEARDAVLVPLDTAKPPEPAKLVILEDGVEMAAVPPRGTLAVWTLGAIQPGRYWLGIQSLTGQGDQPDAAQSGWSLTTRINGVGVDLLTMTAPVPVGNGRYVAELRSTEPFDLRPGDRITVEPSALLGKLILYPTPPRPGPIARTPGYLTSGRTELWRSAVRLSAGPAPGEARAQVWIRNLDRGPQTLQMRLRVTDYSGRTVAEHRGPVVLDDLGAWETNVSFRVGASPRYRAVLELSAGRVRTTETTALRANVTEGLRRMMYLDGAWQQTRVPGVIEIGAPPADQAEWEHYWVPGQMRMGRHHHIDPKHRDVHVGWVRKHFDLPKEMEGRRLALRFERIREEAALYVNGQYVTRHFGGLAPLVADVTPYIRPGRNEILLGVRDFIAAIEPNVLKAEGPGIQNTIGFLIAPLGGSDTSAGLLDHVALTALADVAVEDTFIRCSARKRALMVDVTVSNASSVPRTVTVTPLVRQAGTPVLQLGRRTLTLSAGSSQTVQFRAAFPKARFWTLDDPHLYELSVTVAEGGQPLDEWCERFGFREFYARDGLFMLNNRVAKLSSLPKEEGGSFRRHSWPTVDDLDASDEEGYLYAYPAPWCVGPREFMLKSDLYWSNATMLAIGAVRARRNHPSIVLWEVSNEWTCFSFTIGSDEPGGGVATSRRRLRSIAEALRREDPTRMFIFSADGDLGGWNELVSLHYPLDGEPFRRTSGRYIPDAYFWRPLDRNWKKGQSVVLRSNSTDVPFRWRSKPVMMNEIGQYSICVAHDPTILGGEEVYRSSAVAAGYWQSLVDRYILDGARDLEACHYQPWSHPRGAGTSEITFPPRYAVPLDYCGHWRSGERVQFQVNIHHDVLWPEAMTVRWELRDASGRRLAGQTLADRTFAAGEIERTRIRFTAPTVQVKTRGRFVLEVARGDQVDYRRVEDMVIYPPRPEPVRLTKRFALFDPAGKAAPALARLGVKPAVLTAVDDASLAGVDALLIGPQALTADTVGTLAPTLQTYVRNGGRVIVFEQVQPPPFLPYLVHSDRMRVTSFAFPRVPAHPLLKDIEASDLCLWRGDRVVSRNDYLKPSRGACLPIVDAGGGLGLEWTPLMEVFHGQGSYVLCQMQVISKAGLAPVADTLLGNLLAYADGPLFRTPQPVGLVAEADAPLAQLMTRLGAKVMRLAPGTLDGFTDCEALLVDAAGPMPPEQARRVVELAARGGRVLLHGLTPQTAPTWSAALGHTIALREIHDYYRGRAVRDYWDDLLTGLSMHELHWHRNVGGDGSGFETRWRLAELARFEVVTDAPDAVPCTHPAIFVSVPIGKGRLLIDTAKWDTAGDMVGSYARRIASVLAMNLGADFESLPAARHVEGPLAYVPINLAAHVNRPMADEVAEDQKGGWSDQGARIDGREFPTGRVVVKGIPFLIGGEQPVGPHAKSIIVLNGCRFAPPCTEITGIPVNLRAETLHFLHTCAWCGESVPVMSYIVRYEDGSFEEIRVVGGINIQDWWLPTGHREFLEEMPGVSTEVGLVAENPTFECAAMYLMRWVNPHPDKTIVALDVLYRQHPDSLVTPIIAGITAGVKADRAATLPPEPPRDTGRAATLTAQAEGLLNQGQYEAAAALLREAVAADPLAGRSFWLLGRSLRLAGHPDEATRAYRTAVGLLPESTEVLNELAELLVAQGKKIQASAIYRQSLRLNWNQPPVLTALERLP